MEYSSTIQIRGKHIPTSTDHRRTSSGHKRNELHVAKYSIKRMRINNIMNRYQIDENPEIRATCTSSTRVHRVPEYRFDQVPNSPRYNTRVYTQVRIHWIEYYAVYYYGHIRPLVHTEPGGVQMYTTRARDEADDITLIGPTPVIINLLHH